MSVARPRSIRTDAAMKRAEEQAETYVAPLLELLKDEDGVPLSSGVTYLVMRQADIFKRCESYLKQTRPHKQFHDTDILTPAEQLETQKKKLYDEALLGNIQAQKLWFEQHFEMNAEQTFNVSIMVKDYRIKDKSLRQIAQSADRHVVHDILGGIRARLEMDGGTPELIDQLTNFEEDFQAWATDAYAPKNA